MEKGKAKGGRFNSTYFRKRQSLYSYKSKMNLKAAEQILIKDIFAVSVNKKDNALLYLPEFVRDVSTFGGITPLT